MANQALVEKRILVVEDDYFLADGLCSDLLRAGATVIGPAPSVTRALDLIQAEPDLDAALLDLNLSGELSYPIADALLSRSVPFVFTSACDDSFFAGRYSNVPRCLKPAEFFGIVRALAGALEC